MIERLKAFCQYVFSKRSELGDLDQRDALLAQLNVKIYHTVNQKTIESVPLKQILYLHKLDRNNSQEKLAERIDVLHNNHDRLEYVERLSLKDLSELLPSISCIKVVGNHKGQYIAFEGNGRLAALKAVCSEDIRIEVEEYHFSNSSSILKRINQLRRKNGLT